MDGRNKNKQKREKESGKKETHSEKVSICLYVIIDTNIPQDVIFDVVSIHKNPVPSPVPLGFAHAREPTALGQTAAALEQNAHAVPQARLQVVQKLGVLVVIRQVPEKKR